MTNIRLVCSTWKALIGRQIWGTLITDFAPTEKQDLEALLSPGSGILPYVRRLIICKVPSLFREDLEVALRRFLECMPRKSLKVFLSLSAMSPKIFKDLIAWHPKLERFEAFIEPEENEFTQYEWIAQRLSEVRTYQMWIKRKKEEDSLEFHRKLMTAMLRLQDLEVYYEPRRVYQASAKLYLDISPAFVNGTYFPRLSILTLMGVDMRTCTSPLLERFEVYKLRKLYLLDCSFSSIFIASLSSWYKENPGLLDTFHFRYPCHLSDPAAMILRASLEQFITVCPSLSRLIIEYRGHDALPVSCITKHGETLQSLRMGMDAWPDRHDTIKLYTPTCSARDLETMLRACKKLEGVGLDMPFDAVDLGSVSDAEPSFELARQATDEMYALPQFEHFLVSHKFRVNTFLSPLNSPSSADIHEFRRSGYSIFLECTSSPVRRCIHCFRVEMTPKMMRKAASVCSRDSLTKCSTFSQVSRALCTSSNSGRLCAQQSMRSGTERVTSGLTTRTRSRRPAPTDLSWRIRSLRKCTTQPRHSRTHKPCNSINIDIKNSNTRSLYAPKTSSICETLVD